MPDFAQRMIEASVARAAYDEGLERRRMAVEAAQADIRNQEITQDSKALDRMNALEDDVQYRVGLTSDQEQHHLSMANALATRLRIPTRTVLHPTVRIAIINDLKARKAQAKIIGRGMDEPARQRYYEQTANEMSAGYGPGWANFLGDYSGAAERDSAARAMGQSVTGAGGQAKEPKAGPAGWPTSLTLPGTPPAEPAPAGATAPAVPPPQPDGVGNQVDMVRTWLEADMGQPNVLTPEQHRLAYDALWDRAVATGGQTPPEVAVDALTEHYFGLMGGPDTGERRVAVKGLLTQWLTEAMKAKRKVLPSWLPERMAMTTTPEQAKALFVAAGLDPKDFPPGTVEALASITPKTEQSAAVSNEYAKLSNDIAIMRQNGVPASQLKGPLTRLWQLDQKFQGNDTPGTPPPEWFRVPEIKPSQAAQLEISSRLADIAARRAETAAAVSAARANLAAEDSIKVETLLTRDTILANRKEGLLTQAAGIVDKDPKTGQKVFRALPMTRRLEIEGELAKIGPQGDQIARRLSQWQIPGTAGTEGDIRHSRAVAEDVVRRGKNPKESGTTVGKRLRRAGYTDREVLYYMNTFYWPSRPPKPEPPSLGRRIFGKNILGRG